MARIRARELRKPTREPISKDKHNKAVQTFRAMHVEALSWSGLTAKAYAEGHRICQQPAYLARPSRCGSSEGRLACASSSQCPCDDKQ